MNLLHFVVQQLEEKNPKLLKVADEFDSLNDAAMHSVETITTEVTQLKDGVAAISKQIESLQDEGIKAQIQEFLDVSVNFWRLGLWFYLKFWDHNVLCQDKKQ